MEKNQLRLSFVIFWLLLSSVCYPQAGDFDIKNLTQTKNKTVPVTITYNGGKSEGITIYYTGKDGTKSTTMPKAVGEYTVTYDVAATTGFSEEKGKIAGTLKINDTDQTPVADDFDISGNGILTYNGGVKTVIIKSKLGKSDGDIKTYYEGKDGTAYAKSETPPINAGTYAVTFDVAAATGFTATKEPLPAGPLIIKSVPPTADDFNVSGTGTFFYNGGAKAVTITPKEGKSDGRVTIYYGGKDTPPKKAGTYAITFDIAATPGFSEAKGLKTGETLTIVPMAIYCIIAGLLLVMAALIVFVSHLFSRKLIIKEINNLIKDIEVIDKDIQNIKQDYKQKYDSVANSIIDSPKSLSNTDDMRDKFGSLERSISEIKGELRVIADLKNKVDTLYSGKKMTESITSGSLGVIEAFNLWAASPYIPLPEAFHYIEGEINIRTKREIRESAGETKWITNRSGAKKYLFPNPNSFNQMTNILELYKMDQAKLKGRGQNKIKITTPCEMTKEGFVEFAGELELL